MMRKGISSDDVSSEWDRQRYLYEPFTPPYFVFILMLLGGKGNKIFIEQIVCCLCFSSRKSFFFFCCSALFQSNGKGFWLGGERRIESDIVSVLRICLMQN